jgi:hypothetical protein
MPQIAIDNNDTVYITYLNSMHVFLNRYDGTEVSIWDHDTGSWTTTLADGDPIDTGGTNLSGAPIQMVIDPFNRVYITYEHYNGTNWHIYLSRYDGTDVGIWDNDTANWTTTMSDGDPIDTNTANDAAKPSISVDLMDGIVYVSFDQSDGTNYHVYLSRYDGAEVSIWDNDTTDWTTTLTDGDPIDTGAANWAHAVDLAIDENGTVYLVHMQSDGADYHVFLSRYDGVEVSIWDNDTASWSTTLSEGDPIDINNGNEAFYPQLAIDSDGKVFISYFSNDITNQIYINRYDGTEVSIWDNDTASWTTTLADGDPINTNTGGWGASPNLAIGDDGTVYFTYSRSGHVYLSRCLNTITPPPPLTTPTVNPTDGAVNIEIDANISATFIENIHPATITTNTIYITGISGSVSYDVPTKTATFNPNSNLSYDTTYTATISTGVEDLDGNSLQTDYTWFFTTEAAPDTIPPTVISTSPSDNEADVPVDSIISVIFSEDMDAATINSNTLHLDNAATCSVSYDAGTRTATLMPSADLNEETNYIVTVTTGARDMAGNALQAESKCSFTTWEPLRISNVNAVMRHTVNGASE